jgi:hypothetical protein
MFQSVDDAARALLLTTCRILDRDGVQYVIAGGWVPYFRGGIPSLTHPGTRDVDVLFKDNTKQVEQATRALSNAGFVYSGKHDFQLFLPVTVGKQRFIFNVDLMHSAEQHKQPQMFADIFELGVEDAYDPTGKRWVRSIRFLGAEVVFEEALWSNLAVTGTDTAGATVEVQVPLLDEAALILSKASSIKNEKRPRDAFDIYYVLFGAANFRTVETLRRLATKYPDVSGQLDILLTWITENKDKFDGSVNQFAKEQIPNPADNILRVLRALRR